VGCARSSTITLPLLLTGGAGLSIQGVEILRASQRASVVLTGFATTLQTVSVCASLLCTGNCLSISQQLYEFERHKAVKSRQTVVSASLRLCEASS